MAYVHKVVEGVDVIELVESVDLYSVYELRQFCREVLKKNNKKIVIGMEKLNYIDSSGIGMLYNLSNESKLAKVSLKLAHLSPNIGRIFNLTNMKDYFEIFPTVSEAIRAFG